MEAAGRAETYRWRTWFGASFLLAASWTGVAAMTLQMRPGMDAVAVIFPPWWTGEQALTAAAAADAAIIRVGGLATILIVKPADNDGLRRLHNAGAWLAIDQQAVGACIEN